MRDHTSAAPGIDMLMLSLKMKCLAQASKTPIKTFFRFVTVFYEHGCMRTTNNSQDDSEVTVSSKCVDEVV